MVVRHHIELHLRLALDIDRTGFAKNVGQLTLANEGGNTLARKADVVYESRETSGSRAVGGCIRTTLLFDEKSREGLCIVTLPALVMMLSPVPLPLLPHPDPVDPKRRDLALMSAASRVMRSSRVTAPRSSRLNRRLACLRRVRSSALRTERAFAKCGRSLRRSMYSRTLRPPPDSAGTASARASGE